MNSKETKKVLAYLREAYPNGKTGGESTVRLWQDLLEPYDFEIAWFAAKNVARTWTGFAMPPAAVLIEEIETILGRNNTAIEDWNNFVEPAIKRGSVFTWSEFEELPERVKHYFGGVSTLRTLAMMPREQLANEKARFLKNAPVIDARIKSLMYTPETIRDLLTKRNQEIEQRMLEERNEDDEK